MRKLFDIANQYIKECTWKDLSLLKFCLCAIGVMIGTLISPKQKKNAFAVAGGIFTVTYIPLMKKYFQIVFQNRK